MSVKQGGNTIAGGGTVDQTYDGTSTNAQSGTAVAGAISNMVTTDTAQTISGEKTLTANLYVDDSNIHMRTNFAKGTAPNSDHWKQYTVCDNSGNTGNDHKLGAFVVVSSADGAQTTRLLAHKNITGDTSNTQLYVGYNASGTIITSAPACTNTNSIVTTTSRSVASQNVVFGFGNGLKIAAKHINLTGGTEATWNYGITFSASPTVTICQKSGVSATSGATMWVRGAPGNSSCKVYSGSTTSAMLIVVGY